MSTSAADQARLRRERREKKILAQGNSRLEKIAGLQGGATAREAMGSTNAETPHPDPPEPDIADIDNSTSRVRGSQSRQHEHALSPGRNLFGVDGGDEDPFNMLRGENDPFANMPEELKNDPMIKLLMNNPMFGQAMQSGGQGGAGADPDMDSADMNRLADKISRQLMGGLATDPQSEQVVVPDTFAWKWKFLRIVSIVTVLGYLASQLEDYHFARNPDITDGLPIFYTFVVFSLSLQSLRLILDRGRPLPGSMIATVGSFLPHPFGTLLVSFARYRMIVTDFLEDFAGLVFGLALMYYFKTR